MLAIDIISTLFMAAGALVMILTSFDGHPPGYNCNLLHNIFCIPEHVLYLRPCKNGYRRYLRRHMKMKFPNFVLWEYPRLQE